MTIFGPKTQQPVETYTRFQQPEQIPKGGKIQNGDTGMETEWVTSIDFKDANFHITIQSRKYLHFHVQGQTYQFKALPFGLSTAPMEFTVVAKEVKLMALQMDPPVPRRLVGLG